ncbi:MAG: TRAP transporter small permease [Rubrivivax sp.]|nr:TRAP transporter small permease [Rubrivivax sp.]
MKRLESLFATAAALALFAMMALTFADVVGRKFFDNSLTGAVELTEIFMLMMIFIALPLASRAGEHIAFDLFDRLLPAAVLRWQKVLSNALTALIFSGAAWVVFVRAARTMEFGDVTATLAIRIGPFHYLVGVMLVLTALIHLHLGWREWRQRRSEEPA